MQLEHLQDIYWAESILTNCEPARRPSPSSRVERSTHTALPALTGASQPHQVPLMPVFSPPPRLSFPLCIPVWVGEWRLFHQASVERQSISYIWWISPDWDKLGSRTKRYGLEPPSIPHLPASSPPSTQLGRDLHSSLAAETLHYTSFLFPLFSSHICLSPPLGTMIPLKEGGVDLNLTLTHRDYVTFIWLQLPQCGLFDSNRGSASGFEIVT